MPYGISMTTTEAPRRGAKLGVIAVILAILPAIYIGVTYLVGLGATGQPGTEGAAATAEGMLWIGLFTVPLFLFVAFILGIIALIADRALGKILGALAVLVFIAGIVLVVLFWFSPQGPANWTNF